MKNTFIVFAIAGCICASALTGCGSEGGTITAGADGSGPKYPTPGLPVKPVVLPNTAVGGSNQMTITWNPDADALSYNIYWATSPGVTKSSNRIAGVDSPYIQKGLAPGTIYYYIVVPVYEGGEGLPSPEISGTTLPS